MRLTWIAATGLSAAALPFAYAQAQHEAARPYPPPPGSNEVLRSPLAGTPGVEVIVSDVVIPPNGQVARHYHPGEEFLYLIEGSAIHVEDGKADQPLKAGDSYAIPPRALHAPRRGHEGARAVAVRGHTAGQPARSEATPH